MRVITTYVADDGACFNNQEDALRYEKELKKEKGFRVDVCESHSYSVWIRAKNKKEAIEKFYNEPEWSEEKEDYEICIDSVEIGEVREE